MKRFAGMALLACFAAVVCGKDDKKFESKDGRFAALFPGTPKTTTKKVNDLDLNITMSEMGKARMAVMYFDRPAEKGKEAKPKDVLDGGEKGLITNFKAKVTSSKDIEFGKDKYPARELVAEKDDLHLRLTLVLVGNRLYQVFVVGPKDAATGKVADEFFKSFEITK